MTISKFGAKVRELRRLLNLTLMQMARDLETSPAFLSAMETGRSKIPVEWAGKIAAYFNGQGQPITEQSLKRLAYETNESVPLDGLPAFQKRMIAGFASSDLNHEQLAKLRGLFEDIYGKEGDDE